MVAGCRSSGLLTSSGLIYSGKCKLVSIHATNTHGVQTCGIVIYDNTAASGKVVAQMMIPPLQGVANDSGGAGDTLTATSLEFDMHSVMCENGLYIAFTDGTPKVTVEFA